MERYQLDEITRHLQRYDAGTNAKGEARTGISLLGEAVAGLCKSSKAGKMHQYRTIAEQLPAIAGQIGVAHDAFDATKLVEERTARTEGFVKELKRDNYIWLAPVFLQWMCIHFPPHASALLEKVGYYDREPTLPLVGIQSNSPYTLERMFDLARSQLILIAQNHGHMVMTEDEERYHYWPKLLDALLRGVKIDIVAMHPSVGPRGEWSEDSADILSMRTWPDAVAPWGAYIRTPEFGAQLDHFWTTMDEWWEMYKETAEQAEGEVGRLRIFGAYFTPNTISLIDPRDSHALLVLSPRTSDPKSVLRPQFAIKRSLEPSAYAYYYSEIEYSFAGHYWVKVLG